MELLFTVKPSTREFFAVGYSANGQLFWTMGEQWPSGRYWEDNQKLGSAIQSLRLWDAGTGKELAVGGDMGLTGHTIACHQSGKELAVIHLPDVAKALQPAGGRVGMPSNAEDVMETVRLWDIASAKEKFRFDDPVERKI